MHIKEHQPTSNDQFMLKCVLARLARTYFGVLVLLSASVMLLASCHTAARRVQLADERRFVGMFGRYNLEVNGGAPNQYQIMQIECRVNFKEPIPDTTDKNTIPYLRIDSLCFHGDCLPEDSCYRPSNMQECDLYVKSLGIWRYDHPSEMGEIYRIGDGYWHHTFYWTYPNEAYIPKECIETPIIMTVHASLRNAATDSVFATETKEVELQVIEL